MVEIRQLTQAELDESIRLSEYAFQYELSEEQRRERMATTVPDQIWGAFLDGRLAAKLTIFPMETWINGERSAMGGIASVATWPEYRRRGLVARLMDHALETMKRQGQTLSFLHPFEFGFYRKFGWELYCGYKQYELTVRQLPRPATADERIERTTDWRVLDAVYEQYASRFNGMLVRTEEWWQHRLIKGKKGGFALCRAEDGTVQGYIHYHVADRVMTVHEMVSLSERARLALWRFVANHDSMIDRVKLKAPENDNLPFFLDDPRIKQEIVPYFTARIVDAEAFLQKYRFNGPDAGGTKRLTLRVADDRAPWNNAVYALALASGTEYADVRKTNEEDAALSCSIGTLTAVLLGYVRPLEMHAAGRLTGSAEAAAALEAIVPRRQPFLLDYF